MIDQNNKYTSILRDLIGEVISSISNSQFFFNGARDDEDIGDVEIITESGLKICLKLLADGESVGVYKGDLMLPSSFEVTEGELSSWKKLPIEQKFKIPGSKIVAIDAMRDRYLQFDTEVIAGWRIKLSNNNYIVFYNCGDNARVLFNELPDDAPEGIITIWQPV